MPDQTSNGMQCNEFETLLSDAIDGVLTGTGLDRFQAHARVCGACGPLFAEAEAGRNWLKGLTEVEPPASLVTNILASTTGVDTQRLRVTVRSPQPRISWWERVQASLPDAGADLGDGPPAAFCHVVWHGILRAVGGSDRCRGETRRPEADQLAALCDPAHVLRHASQVVHYYENMRIVYEVESRVHEIKRNVAPAEPGRKESRPAKQKDDKNDTTQQPEQKQERNYSQTDNHLILASAPLGPSSSRSACSVGDH